VYSGACQALSSAGHRRKGKTNQVKTNIASSRLPQSLFLSGISQLWQIKKPSRCVVLKLQTLAALSCGLCRLQRWARELPQATMFQLAACSLLPIPARVFPWVCFYFLKRPTQNTRPETTRLASPWENVWIFAEIHLFVGQAFT